VRRVQARAVYEGSDVELEEDMLASESMYSTDYLPSTDEPVASWRYEYIKRSFDVFCTTIMIAVFAVPGLLIAAAILLTSEGPVFYHEERVGRNGRPFQIWKFRTMYRSVARLSHLADEHTSGTVLQWRTHKHPRDPRITAVGSFLRQWSLDELPQLFNVLRGEMSLIGPRPVIAAETALYGDFLGYYLAVKPGLSGLWQVSGRSDVDYAKRVRLDALYVLSWSMWADLKILFLTIPAVLGRVGAR